MKKGIIFIPTVVLFVLILLTDFVIYNQSKETKIEFNTIRKENGNLTKHVLEQDAKILFLEKMHSSTLHIDVNSATGYHTINTSIGKLLVSFDKLTNTNSGAGCLFSLKVGNPTTADISNNKFTVYWKNSNSLCKEYTNKNTRSVTIGDIIRKGEWTPIEIMLQGIKKSEIKTMKIAFEIGDIHLGTERNNHGIFDTTY